MKKILPICEKHNIVTPVRYANILSILLTDTRILPWVNSNYILIEGIEWGEEQQCLYKDAYWIGMEKNLLPEFLEVRRQAIYDGNCIEVIQKLIDKNEYIYLQIDGFYIEQCIKGNEEHVLHDLLIYGYDSSNEEVFVLGVDKRLHYGKLKVPYKNIKLAIQNRVDATIWNKDFVNGEYQKWVRENLCLSIQYNADKIMFKYRVSYFISMLERYISYNKLNERYFIEIDSELVYMGIRYYDLLIKNLYIENGYKLFILINHLFEHKTGMIEKFRYLYEYTSEQQILNWIEQYRILIHGKARRLQLMMIRTRIKMLRNQIEQKQLIQKRSKIIKVLTEMKQDEYRILSKMIMYLKYYLK